MNNEYEFTDRYQALGVSYPDPATMCKGPCEGLGFYPQSQSGLTTDAERDLWNEAHGDLNAHLDGPCDGWHFIRCSDCNGTGKKQ